ncbi:hypothetical protein AAFF_G00103070 [Aldrovandia affinis]|uniref:Uncharacterized protein n=1 Tax=Aldrovandia affinis TaxID=143900 RepID=A0AAD7WBI5_9TELE|nr:hypothetical protein AAFF_G00103070 [Aldrovandia affinis]
MVVILGVLSLVILSVILLTPDESHLSQLSPLTVEDLETEEFKLHDPCVTWLNENEVTLRSRAGHILKYSLHLNLTTTLLDNSTFDLKAAKFKVSADQKFVLLAYNIHPSARRATMSVQDLSHWQTPQRTSPVEVTHHTWRAASTHPVPPDSSGHPRGNHHLATGQPCSARRATMSVQDLSHWQTPQRTLPVEVTHHTWRAASTHPVPPDSSGHRRGNHHLATGQPCVQGPVRARKPSRVAYVLRLDSPAHP